MSEARRPNASREWLPAPTGVAIHTPERAVVHGRGLLTALLVAALLWSLLQVDRDGGFVRTGGLDAFGGLVGGMLSPDLSGGTVARAIEAAWITAVYAVAGLSVALLASLPLSVLASGVLTRGRRWHGPVVVATRGLLAALRSVHELVWAWLFVAAVGLSPFAAIFALALPYSGVLGRIYADLLNDVPEAPLRALRSSGAGEFAVLLYGRGPMVLPGMVSYAFYRFECALRASAIMGFVGLSGLGFQIQIALDDLAYGVVATHLIALIVLIAAVEAWSSLVRRELTR